MNDCNSESFSAQEESNSGEVSAGIFHLSETLLQKLEDDSAKIGDMKIQSKNNNSLLLIKFMMV